MTTFGFFSVVRKPGEKHLTVRTRVRRDLDMLRAMYLPSLSLTEETKANDYRYRATVEHAALAAAMSKIVSDIDYSNFKSAVEAKQGAARERVYADVWSVVRTGLAPLDNAPSELEVIWHEVHSIQSGEIGHGLEISCAGPRDTGLVAGIVGFEWSRGASVVEVRVLRADAPESMRIGFDHSRLREQLVELVGEILRGKPAMMRRDPFAVHVNG